jgi:hypothetical protein
MIIQPYLEDIQKFSYRLPWGLLWPRNNGHVITYIDKAGFNVSASTQKCISPTQVRTLLTWMYYLTEDLHRRWTAPAANSAHADREGHTGWLLRVRIRGADGETAYERLREAV